jgi:hypothetical protein
MLLPLTIIVLYSTTIIPIYRKAALQPPLLRVIIATKLARTFQSNDTGDTIAFQNSTNASATSFEPGITGFEPNNTMRNMTNPVYQMEENPLQLEENPLTNLTNPLK